MSSVARLASAVPGEPPHLVSVFAHQPALLERFFGLYGAAWNDPAVNLSLKELGRLRCVRTIDCNA